MDRNFERYFLRLLLMVGMIDLMKNDTAMADSDVTIDYPIDSVFIVGSIDQVVQKLAE